MKFLTVKKSIKIIICLVIVFIMILGITFKEKNPQNEQRKVETLLLKENLEFEINSELKLLSLVSDDNRVKILSEDERVDTSNLGLKELSIKYETDEGDKTKSFNIVIVDTETPIIEFKKELTTVAGTKIDLLRNVKVSDNSKEKIEVIIEGKYDFNKDGKYNLKYVAIDSSNNKKEEGFTLIVNKKVVSPQTPVVPKPFINVTQQEIENEKYYIPNNLERYLAYNDGTKTAHEIVTNVNCNIDRPFYTDIKPADVSKGYLILVNKYYAVDRNYKPANLTSLSMEYTRWNNSYLATEAYDAYIQMINDGRSLGYKLIDTSSLRSYSGQESLFNKYVKQNGLQWALKSSAKPGHSEHETGLASDVVNPNVGMHSFGNTKEFAWISENAYKYGFILRYPKGKEYLTGYKYEPWHYRYVGKDVAEYIYKNDIVFEEYYAYYCEYKGQC